MQNAEPNQIDFSFSKVQSARLGGEFNNKYTKKRME